MLLLTCFAQICFSISPDNNPLFKKQYYIQNDGTIFNGIKGEDLNVVPAWNQNATGEGVHIIIINDGCQSNHSELKDRFNYSLSYNYENDLNDTSYDPRQFITSMGTKLASIAAGSDNDICGIGIAYQSSISCINILSSDKAYKNYFNGIKRDKNVSRSVRVFPFFSKYLNGYCKIDPFVKNDEIFFQFTQAIFISTIQSGVLQANEDLNYYDYPSIPYILSFAEISQRGGRVSTSLRGNVVLASVVTGGGDYNSNSALLSAYISTGDGFNETCSQTVFPLYTGGAMAAGVISLILSATKEPLQRNDITAIIALTSVQNDPYSKSWKTNKNGIRYSPIYGFGRLDAEAAVKMASGYTHKKMATPKIVLLTNLQQKIPSFLSGFYDIQLEFTESKINYIDFVELILEFTKDFSDYSLFRVYIISPSGTCRLVKDISPIQEPETHYYRITARDFFGEPAEGNWTIRFLRENVGTSEYMLTECGLAIHGYEDTNFTKQTTKKGSNPFKAYDKIDAKLEIQVPTKGNTSQKHEKDDVIQIQCNTIFSFTVITDDEEGYKKYSSVPFDLVLAPYEEDGPFELFGIGKANQENPAMVYCMYQTGKYRLRAINPAYQVSTNDIIVEIINGESYDYSYLGFDEKMQYRKINLSSPYTAIPINILHTNRKTFSNYKISYSLLATLWNIETKKIYDTQLISSVNGYYIYKDSEPCPKCILMVAPLEIEDEDTSQCNTFINALSIVSPNDLKHKNSNKLEKFDVPWNGVCPVPRGIQTPCPTPSISPSSPFTPYLPFSPTNFFSPTLNPHTSMSMKYIIIIIVGTCVLVGLIIFIIFYQVRKKIYINPPATPLLSTIDDR